MTSEAFRRNGGRTTAVAALLTAATFALSGCGLLFPERFLDRVEGPGATAGEDTEPIAEESAEPRGETTEEDVFDISVGTCLPSSDTGEGEEVMTVETIPCTAPHESEAYAASDMPDGGFPGESGMEDFAADFCVEEFHSFVGTPYQESELDFWYFSPTQESWDSGDREILCMVLDPSGETTGSLQGASR